MAQSDFTKEYNGLLLTGNYHNDLDVEGFSQMMKDPSACYKFYWLEALVRLISEDITETTFEEITDEMIASAWYSVREFHIHLSGYQNGEIRDALERSIYFLTNLCDLPANASRTEIKNAISSCRLNKEFQQYKKQLTNMVPYRALAGFFRLSDGAPPWENITRMVDYIESINNQTVVLPYTLGNGKSLMREVKFHPEWIHLIQDNTVNILGWIQFEKIKWLQMNNPEVPGLVYKLQPMDDKMRKLRHVRDLWNQIVELEEIRDVFTGDVITKGKYDVDHFVPWSFVMNDELWNLMPMDSSLNSSKSNRLPLWYPYFDQFARNQYRMYELVQTREDIHHLFTHCFPDNMHSIWAEQELYRPGNTKEEFNNILQKNMQPIYDSARRQGYEIWNY